MTNENSILKKANIALREKDYTKAIELYQHVLQEYPTLARSIQANITIAQKRYNQENPDSLKSSSKSISITPPRLFAHNELEEVLDLKLHNTPRRFFKKFDFALENKFKAAIAQKASTLNIKTESISTSIIMPTYNRAKTIENAIKSIINQSHQNWELIIVNDGSTDNTIEILSKYKAEPRIKIIQGEHKGVSSARNKGLIEASGSFIFYLDSDNTWTSEYIQTMILMLLQSKKRTGYSAISLINDGNEIFGYRGEAFHWEHCLDSNYIDLNAFCHDRNLFIELGGFDENLRRMVDWDLILRYTKHAPPFYAPFIGCQYIDSKKDHNRITTLEPLAFKKVVHLKNRENTADSSYISKNLKLTFAIKIPAPYEKRLEWGDFHYAESLCKALEKLGHSVRIDFHGTWYEQPANSTDVIIVIRGLTPYKPTPGPINIIWNISHPDQVSFDEYESYDISYIASLSYTTFLNTFLSKPVKPLIQCTDTTRFKPNKDKENTTPKNKLLFVGNSRNEFRSIVKKAIDSNEEIEIYGTLWEKFVDSNLIYGQNIPNQNLLHYYSSYMAILNDHWDSMRVFGLVSNRIFDVLASGGNLISDAVPSISRIFGESVAQVHENEGINAALKKIQCNPLKAEQKQEIFQIIEQYHSFDARAKTICNDIFSRLGLPKIHTASEHIPLYNDLNRKKIGLILQNGPARPTSSAYIRLISPLTSDLAQTKFEIILLESSSDSRLLKCDIVIIQRVAITSIEAARDLINTTKNHNIKIYIDTDDAFSNLPDSHHEKDFYQGLDGILRHLMNHASHVWFSTIELARLYQTEYTSASVLPNTLDPRLWINYRKPRGTGSFVPKFQILYMGTSTHDKDFNFVLPALDALEEARPGSFELTIIGALKTPPKRTWIKTITPPKGKTLYPKFVKWLTTQHQFDIGIAPLEDNKFNQCKSDIKFLDYSALGIATICSRVNAYYKPIELGLVIATQNTSEQWLRAFSFAFENRELMRRMAEEAKNYLWNERSNNFAVERIFQDIFYKPKLNPAKAKPTTLQNSTQQSKIAVCAHIYYSNLWAKITQYLKNIEEQFDLYITCHKDNIETINQAVRKDYPQAIIIPLENKGMDVYPFLYVNHTHNLWRYSSVLKLHTKNEKNEDSKILGTVLLDGVLGTKGLVKKITSEINENRVGIVGAECLYRSAQALMYDNKESVDKILYNLGISNPKEDWGFIAGTIFWINGALLKMLSEKFYYIDTLFEASENVKTGIDGTNAHAVERVFGLLPALYHLKTAVSFPTSSMEDKFSLRYIRPGELTRNLTFRTGSTAHLIKYKNLIPWSEICRKSEYFDEKYYLSKGGELIPSDADPAIHFVLFGDDLKLNPSIKFSSAFYIDHNKDVTNARLPSLVHFLTRGLKEGRRFTEANQ